MIIHFLLLSFIFASCSGRTAPEAYDADEDIGFDYDVSGMIEEWDVPVGINLFPGSTGAYTDPRSNKILLPDFLGGAIFLFQHEGDPYNQIVFKQRISHQGERLWGDALTGATSEIAFEWKGRIRGLAQGGIPDEKGGVYVLYNRFHINRWVTVGNHIFEDGSFLYPEHENVIHGPHEDIVKKSIGNSIVLSERLVLNLWINDADFLWENGLDNLCPFSVDENFEDPPAILTCIGLSGYRPPMFKIASDKILYLTSSNIYIEGEELKYVESDWRADVRYNILDENLHSLTGGEIVLINDPAMELSLLLNTLDFELFEFDKKSHNIFVFCSQINHPVIRFHISDYDLIYSWTFEDNITGSVGSIYSIKGDAQGGLYVVGMSQEREEDCIEIDCCNLTLDACSTKLRIQRLDPEGSLVYAQEQAVIEEYKYVFEPRVQVGIWDPRPVFARSIDNESDGEAVYFWRKPLLHTGNSYPDTWSYELGYVICAQKATAGTPASWGDGECIPVAQVDAGYSTWDYYAWYDAVDDGEGGAIVVYNDFVLDPHYHSFLRVQRVSAEGLLMWDDRGLP